MVLSKHSQPATFPPLPAWWARRHTPPPVAPARIVGAPHFQPVTEGLQIYLSSSVSTCSRLHVGLDCCDCLELGVPPHVPASPLALPTAGFPWLSQDRELIPKLACKMPWRDPWFTISRDRDSQDGGHPSLALWRQEKTPPLAESLVPRAWAASDSLQVWH